MNINTARKVEKCKRCGAETNTKYCIACHINRSRTTYRAHAAVRMAIKKGYLPKLDGSINCVDCGAIAKHYDHRDYSKPLDVSPVCGSCNYKRGHGLNMFNDKHWVEIKGNNIYYPAHVEGPTPKKMLLKWLGKN